MKDFYYILGVKQTASADEIKRAYRKLSQKFHPDKNDGDEFFADRFKEINAAYEILSDEGSRRRYDNGKTANSSSQQASSGSNFVPHIEYFKTDKFSFEVDEEITFTWKTINANKVSIKPFGQVQPIGQKTYKLKDFKSPKLSFELLAENTNIGRQAFASLTLTNRTFQDLYQFFQAKINADNEAKVNNQQSQQSRNKTETKKQNAKKTQQELDAEGDKAARPVFIVAAIIIIIVLFLIFSSSKE